MIFPKIQCDEIVQVNDKFRIDVSRSYISKGEAAITKVEIEAEAAAGFIEVTGSAPITSENWLLDWEYATAGVKVITARITTDGAPTTKTFSVTALTEVIDKLFSDDDDLAAIETDILRYIPKGRNTFKYVHREAQREILEWLYTNGYTRDDRTRLTKDNVIDVNEIKFWSKYMVLRMIYEDISKQETDVFARKAKEYENDEHKWRQKSTTKFDLNTDGVQGENESESFDFTSKSFVRT